MGLIKCTQVAPNAVVRYTMRDVEVEAEAIRQRARGRQDALAQSSDELQQVVAALRCGSASLDDLRGEVDAVATADAVKLAIAIAERVTKRRGIIDPNVLFENL